MKKWSLQHCSPISTNEYTIGSGLKYDAIAHTEYCASRNIFSK